MLPPPTAPAPTRGPGARGSPPSLSCPTQPTRHALPNLLLAGYSFGERMQDLSEVHAATSYGACTYAGARGERRPSEFELAYATYQARGSVLLKVVQRRYSLPGLA
jgi:hypothetical protein